MDVRHELIEVATKRPDDISLFYRKYTHKENNCTFLNDNAPTRVPLMYRRHIKYYDSTTLPFLLAGVNPHGIHSCGNKQCINPTHVL